MDLFSGGHLTHGCNINFSGKFYKFYSYSVDPITEILNYNMIEQQALLLKPKLIIAGASSYSRKINFKKFKEISNKVGAYFMVDMAHIAGLVAANLHQNPVKYADVVTSTTHKTLRGPRGGIILCKKKFASKIDKAVFPGIQGGPLEHIIAAKAQAFLEVLKPDFIKYQKQVIKNTKSLEHCFKKQGYTLVSQGTDNHLLMINVQKNFKMSGYQASKILTKIGIICNKNIIPFDLASPMITSGIRLGTAAMTTRGFKEKEFIEVANIIISVLNNPNRNNIIINYKKVVKIMKNFSIYKNIKY